MLRVAKVEAESFSDSFPATAVNCQQLELEFYYKFPQNGAFAAQNFVVLKKKLF